MANGNPPDSITPELALDKPILEKAKLVTEKARAQGLLVDAPLAPLALAE
jgi:hypothetical protein